MNFNIMSEIERKKPFSTLEKELFLNVIQKYENILTCKKTNALSALKKKQAWEKIRNEFNSSKIVSQKAATKQLIKLWYNMKAKAREAKTKENVRFLTGGGPFVNDINPIDSKVMDIDKNLLTNVQVDIDSDISDTLIILGDENDEAWNKNATSSVDIPDIHPTPSSLTTQNDFNVQPNVSHNEDCNQKKEENDIDMTPMRKNSFASKYINKIDLLKIKILEEELKHQQNMHKEELLIKVKEREHKEKLWEIELKIKQKELEKL